MRHTHSIRRVLGQDVAFVRDFLNAGFRGTIKVDALLSDVTRLYPLENYTWHTAVFKGALTIEYRFPFGVSGFILDLTYTLQDNTVVDIEADNVQREQERATRLVQLEAEQSGEGGETDDYLSYGSDE